MPDLFADTLFASASAAPDPVAGGGVFVIAAVVIMIVLGCPLFVVLGVLALACAIFFPVIGGIFDSLDAFTNNYNVMERITELEEQPSMVAIPFFMVAGAIMARGAIARRLVHFANAAFGWLPGGLAVSAIMACGMFAAISGSSPVTVITIGAIMLPAMAEAGYPERMSVGLVTSAGTLGIIIPPSIPMIVYAIFSSNAGAPVKVDDLFIAGIIPGFLIAAFLTGYVVIKGRALERQKFSFKKLVQSFLDGVWALFLPIFIIGGIDTGLFDATEAAAVSVVLALMIELSIHRSLKVHEIPKILTETSILMGAILIIICVAFGFMEFIAFKDIPGDIVRWLAQFELTPFTFILLLNVFLLLVGCLMDIISAIILFVPLVVPIATELGFDPVHLGLIFIVNLEIGYLTPPLGLNLFVATTYFKKPFGLVIRAVLPYLLMLFASLAIVTYVPTISKGLVNLKDGESFGQSFPEHKVLQPKQKDIDPEAAMEDEAGALEFDGPADGDGKADPANAPEIEKGKGTIQDFMKDPEFKENMKGFMGDEGAEEEEDDEEEEDFELPPLDEDDAGSGVAPDVSPPDSGPSP